ncbi:MAG TPA: type II toxin-antitoxin system RelE/ParE family toxin [Chloroflexota bacterium]
MRTRWTGPARENLREIRRYIAQDNPRAAAAVVHRITSATRRLGRFPRMGREARLSDGRELVVAGTPYVILYRVLADTVDIEHVRHTARFHPFL